LWLQKHNVFHHVFTNVFEWDDDLESRGHLRLSPRQPWRARFRNQHRFFLFFYSLSTIEWFFVKDFAQYFRLRMTHRSIPRMSLGEKVEFWVCKLLYITLFVAVPFLFLPPVRVAMGLLLFHLMLGLSITLILQLGHGTVKVEFPEPTGGSPAAIDDEWAGHEMRTTADFATDNPVANWFCGGLNFQVEHHLFPSLCHTMYPEISPIVQRTAKEFGIPYNLHATYVEALASHYRFLRDLGREPQAV
jgi:linoleoyl-CoA desaturase